MPVSEDDQALLRRHAPQLRYHPLEPYRADSARILTDSFVESGYSNELWSRKTGKLIARARPVATQAQLAIDRLVAAGEEYYPGGPVAHEDDFLRAHAPTLQLDAWRMRTRPGYADVVYARIAPGKNGRSWLQYWFFYLDNPFAVGPIGKHQGDWEQIQVAIVDGKPVAATYSQHDTAERRDWPDVPTVDDAGLRPVVYVAKHSHASYFTAGEHRRLPWALGMANDHTGDGDRADPEPYFLDPEADRWLAWPGRWGDTWETIDRSPPGPAQQRHWREPDWFHDEKAESSPPRSAFEGALVKPADFESIELRIDDATLAIDFALPRNPHGASQPIRAEVAVRAAEGPPSFSTFDISSLDGTFTAALPPAEGPYRVRLGLYDEHDVERLVEPPPVPAVRAANPFESARRPIRPGDNAHVRRLRPQPARPAAPVQLIVRAPDDAADGAAELERATRAAPIGRGGWTVAPLFGDTSNRGGIGLDRYFSVAADVQLESGQDLAAATFEAAHRLELPAGWEVEPDAPSDVFRPDTDDGVAAAFESGGRARDLRWALDAIGVPGAWGLKLPDGGRARGEGVVIAQPDTGFTDHPELELGALDRQRDYDVLTGRDDAHAVLRGIPPFKFPSHGTGTASVAASREHGNVTGSAPLAQIVPIRAAETVAHVRNRHLAVAINYARTLGCDVISISMGGILYPRALRDAIAAAVAEGAIVMAAAGQPLPMVVAPASYPECLAISGTTDEGKPWAPAARGREVDVCAPAAGVWVAATRSDGPDPYHHAMHSGTSFSVALTAGVAALWIAHHGREAIREAAGGDGAVQDLFRDLLVTTAHAPEGWDGERWGAGIVAAEKLLAHPLERSGVERAPAPPAEPADWAVHRAAALAPDLPAGVVDKRLAALVRDDRDALARHSAEIVYRLAEHPEVRREVLEAPTSAFEADGVKRLETLASASLRAALA